MKIFTKIIIVLVLVVTFGFSRMLVLGFSDMGDGASSLFADAIMGIIFGAAFGSVFDWPFKNRLQRYALYSAIITLGLLGHSTLRKLEKEKHISDSFFGPNTSSEVEIKSAVTGGFQDIIYSMQFSFNTPSSFERKLGQIGYQMVQRCALKSSDTVWPKGYFPDPKKIITYHRVKSSESSGYYEFWVSFDPTTQKGYSFRSSHQEGEPRELSGKLASGAVESEHGVFRRVETCSDSSNEIVEELFAKDGVLRKRTKIGEDKKILSRLEFDKYGKKFNGKHPLPSYELPYIGTLNYLEGVRHGDAEMFHKKTGKLTLKGVYQNGKFTGESYKYGKDGKMILTIVYSTGEEVERKTK